MKQIIKSLASSFFYIAIFVFVISIFFGGKINYYTSIINTVAVSSTDEVKAKQTKLDIEKKRLVNYPNYGEKYADIIIPKIDLNLPVSHGDSLTILKKAIGHYAGSYFPGEGGSVILAGHNTPAFFAKIEKLVKGDEITIKTNYGDFKYKVDSYKVADSSDLSSFPVQNDKEMLIMYTCYPIGTIGKTKLRYVVYAYRVGDNNGEV